MYWAQMLVYIETITFVVEDEFKVGRQTRNENLMHVYMNYEGTKDEFGRTTPQARWLGR